MVGVRTETAAGRRPGGGASWLGGVRWSGKGVSARMHFGPSGGHADLHRMSATRIPARNMRFPMLGGLVVPLMGLGLLDLPRLRRGRPQAPWFSQAAWSSGRLVWPRLTRQHELHVPDALDGVEAIRLGVSETKRAVELDRRGHGGQGVEAHLGVSEFAGGGDDGLGQLPP